MAMSAYNPPNFLRMDSITFPILKKKRNGAVSSWLKG